MKTLCLTVAAIALAAAAAALPAFAAVKCYSVFNIETGRMESVCVTGSN